MLYDTTLRTMAISNRMYFTKKKKEVILIIPSNSYDQNSTSTRNLETNVPPNTTRRQYLLMS